MQMSAKMSCDSWWGQEEGGASNPPDDTKGLKSKAVLSCWMQERERTASKEKIKQLSSSELKLQRLAKTEKEIGDEQKLRAELTEQKSRSG